ncbi:MAG: DNA primase [Flavobacteriaceae bacterium]
MISRSTVDQVFETARVEEVIGDFVQLKKAGSNFKGLSPFTDERSPSFMVSPVKQIWKDFSSGKGGNVVAFLMEHEHFTYPEAIKFLANKYGIEIEETEQTNEEKEQANERESMYLVSEFAKDYFHNTLLKSEEGKAIGFSYFKERGFTEETIKKFQLGYSPNSWDAFTSEAIKKGYKLEFLEKTGLTIVKEEKQFDRFKGRVMFPILSMSGRTLGFGGRILTNDKKAAKYLNSPESDIYHKSKVLYGIFHAKQAIAKEDNCYLVEGYTDVIQFAQTGIHNVVSSSGTALTEEQIRLINRLTKNITLLFDGDAAGLRASLRGVDLILEQGMNVKICTFPEGEDPDSFARKNSLEELTLYLEENARDFINFKASVLVDETKNDPVKKADTIRDMVVSISKIPDVIKREIYVQECSRIMDISEEVLFNSLAQILSKNKKEQAKAASKNAEKPFEVVDSSLNASKVDLVFELEKEILEMLLKYGDCEIEYEDYFINIDLDSDNLIKEKVNKKKVSDFIFLNLQEDEIEFSNSDFKTIYNKLIEIFINNEKYNKESLYQYFNHEEGEIIAGILMKYENYKLSNWESKLIFPKNITDDLQVKVSTNIFRLRHLLIENLIDELVTNYNQKNESLKEETIEMIMDYSKLKRDISYFIDASPIPQNRKSSK